MAENTTENILSISLREYKKQIDDLKASMLGLKKGSEEYEKIAQEVRDKQAKLNEVLNDSKTTSTAAVNSMAAMKKELKELKAEANQIDVGSNRFKELSQQIYETTEKLKELEAGQGTYSRNVGNYESGVASLRSEFKELQQQMASMLANGVAPTDAAFVELAKKAGDMKDAMADAQAVISHYADDTKGLATVVDLAKTGAAAYGAFKGTLSLFGIENENVNKSLETMVAVTTTLNSLQQLQTSLVDRASITYRAYHGAMELAGKALAFLGLTSKANTATIAGETSQVVAHTGAMVADTAATGAATTATNIFKKALISTGIGAIVVAIGTLIANLGDLVDGLMAAGKWIGKVTGLLKDNEESEKRAAAAAKRNAEFQEALARTEQDLANKNAELTSTFEVLKAKWDDLDTVEEKRKFVEDYKNEMEALGVEIDNVNDAENFFSTTGAQNFANAIEKRAQLLILQQKLVEKTRQIMESERRDPTTPGYLYSEKSLLIAEIQELSQELASMEKRYTSKQQQRTTQHTTRTTSKTTKADEVDISGNLEKLERLLDEQTKAIQYSYDLLKAKGEASLDDEIALEQKKYELKKQFIEDAIADREEQLKKAGLTAEQMKQIDDDLYNHRQALLEIDREHQISQAEFIGKKNIETYQKLKENYTQIAKNVTAFDTAAGGVVSSWVNKIKDMEPEVAKAYVESMAPKSAQEEILSVYEAYHTENADKIMEYELAEEDRAYEHAQNMINISKSMLQDIAANFGEDSTLYLDQQALVYKMEEEAAEQHYAKVAKIQNKHSVTTKKNNKVTFDSYMQMGSGIADLMDNVAGIMEQDIKDKQESGKISEEEAKKQFETVKTLQLVSATINMIQGAITAYSTAQSLGPIAGPIVGGINAAAVTAMGIMNIQKIKSQQWGSSGDTSGVAGGQATREAANVDFSGVNVNPLLDETADINRITTLAETQQTTQKVVILQSDIADSMQQVQIRQSNTTF